MGNEYEVTTGLEELGRAKNDVIDVLQKQLSSLKFNGSAVADALLSQWANCPQAEQHGKSSRCVVDDCSFTNELFSAAVTMASAGDPLTRHYGEWVGAVEEQLGIRLAPAPSRWGGPNPALCTLRCVASIHAYLRGLPTGDFLRAVLENNLEQAISRADDINIHALPHIVAYVRECVPSIAWGSSEKVNRWLSKDRDSTRKAFEAEGGLYTGTGRLIRPDSETRGIDDEADR
jgi:hypothetical protein